MKTYNELTEKEQKQAIAYFASQLLEDLISGSISFNDKINEDDLQSRIDSALNKMEKNHTPWFAAEAIMETCSDDINGIAQCSAEDAIYSGPDENVISQYKLAQFKV